MKNMRRKQCGERRTMTLDLEDEYGLDLGFDYEKTATEVINGGGRLPL